MPAKEDRGPGGGRQPRNAAEVRVFKSATNWKEEARKTGLPVFPILIHATGAG